MSVMVEIGGKRLYANPEHNGWGILKDGLPDWNDSVDSRDGDDPIPGADGDFEDGSDPIVEGRRVTLRGAHVASSPEWAELETRRWLASLVKRRDLEFRVFEAGQWLALRGARVRGRVRIGRAAGRPNISTFEVTVYSRDPRKYGVGRSIPMDAAVEPSGGLRFPMVDGSVSFGVTGGVLFPGVFALYNPGTAEFYPDRFVLDGPIPSFTIQSESHVIEYSAPIGIGDELILTPYAGGRATLNGADVSHNLLQADWVPVRPGETRGFLFTPTDPGAGSKLTIEYSEGAWW
ncbi:hypothetical protein ACWGR3_28945 [Streptomyces albidoflavus]